MYCPKCGARSDNDRFCRSCGMNLVLVSDALADGEQSGSPEPTVRGRTTFGLFRPATVTNLRRNLHGHSAAAIFGNVIIDLTVEDLPPGETTIRVYSIFGSTDILVDPDVGVRITGVTMFSEVKLRGQEIGNGFFSVNEYVSPGYWQAARRLHIDAISVFAAVKLKR